MIISNYPNVATATYNHNKWIEKSCCVVAWFCCVDNIECCLSHARWKIACCTAIVTFVLRQNETPDRFLTVPKRYLTFAKKSLSVNKCKLLWDIRVTLLSLLSTTKNFSHFATSYTSHKIYCQIHDALVQYFDCYSATYTWLENHNSSSCYNCVKFPYYIFNNIKYISIVMYFFSVFNHD